MTTLFVIVGLLATVYCGACYYLYLQQDRIIFNASKAIYRHPDDVGVAYQNLYLTTSDGVRINAWYSPTSTQQQVILFLHGNTGNMGDRIETVAMLHKLGYSVLMLDYRGYGHSEGYPTEAGTYLDGEAAWNFLINECKRTPEQIILFGRSLGGGIATELATRRTPGGLILESTYSTFPAVAQDVYPWFPARYLVRPQYDTIGKLPKVRCPYLIIHSPDDEFIPYRHAVKLYELDVPGVRKEFLEIHGCHGSGFQSSGDIYTNGLRAFLASLDKAA